MSENTGKYNFVNPETVQIVEKNLGKVIGKIEQNSNSTESLAVITEIFNGLKTLTEILEAIQKKNPNLTEAEAQTIIEAEFTELDKKGKLATLRHQLLNPQRWFNGGKAALIEVGKHYVEENVLYKAGISFCEGFSEHQ